MNTAVTNPQIARRILKAAVTAGITVELDGEFLSLQALGTPDAGLLELLQRHKSDIVQLLRTQRAEPGSVMPAAAPPPAPLFLRDGRVMHRFRAEAIPPSAAPATAALLREVRQMGVVLVADGVELHVVERWMGRLHPAVLSGLKDNAGDVIAVLCGEHRARVAGLPTHQVVVFDPPRQRKLEDDRADSPTAETPGTSEPSRQISAAASVSEKTEVIAAARLAAAKQRTTEDILMQIARARLH
jgi:hypothetical protein